MDTCNISTGADVSEMESRWTAQVSEEDVDALSQVSEGGGMSTFP